jgi:aerobic carbon-monoxide dehydrogenase medium subunit
VEFMHNFDYLRPTSVAEAIEAFRAVENGRFLAGGMTLIPTMKQRLASPTCLIDLSGIEGLDTIRVERTDLVVGAMARHDTIANSPESRTAIPALANLAASIGDPQVRNRGTLGGSIANNDPAADHTAGVLGLGATIITDRRRIAADLFFPAMFETALEPDELVVAVSFPIPLRAGYAKLPQTASRYALVGVMVASTPTGVRVAVTGAAPKVFRHIEMEAALERDFSQIELDSVVTRSEGLNTDMHGSAAYRAHLVDVLAKRAVSSSG